jgi:hypothetical protein
MGFYAYVSHGVILIFADYLFSGGIVVRDEEAFIEYQFGNDHADGVSQLASYVRARQPSVSEVIVHS